jgi:hypothetical protein
LPSAEATQVPAAAVSLSIFSSLGWGGKPCTGPGCQQMSFKELRM